MSAIEQLGRIAVLGDLLGKISIIAQSLTDDPSYTKQDAVEELLDLARVIKEEIILSQF
ncbi:hypothetical protein [Effusibacillus pohliae]|uniref:hypothetical protein n=1 Tax=Effusibacillus pohliae TaxID=232270 RepID=UPI0003642F4E|nr:hypothetical protein [Effusibacillus pohliae]